MTNENIIIDLIEDYGLNRDEAKVVADLMERYKIDQPEIAIRRYEEEIGEQL